MGANRLFWAGGAEFYESSTLMGTLKMDRTSFNGQSSLNGQASIHWGRLLLIGRVWVIENHSNHPGFDIMIRYSTLSDKVLPVQCKTKLVTTTEDAGDGRKLIPRAFSLSLVNCSVISIKT